VPCQKALFLGKAKLRYLSLFPCVPHSSRMRLAGCPACIGTISWVTFVLPPYSTCRGRGIWPCWLLHGLAGSHVPFTSAARWCRPGGPELQSASQCAPLARPGGSRWQRALGVLRLLFSLAVLSTRGGCLWSCRVNRRPMFVTQLSLALCSCY